MIGIALADDIKLLRQLKRRVSQKPDSHELASLCFELCRSLYGDEPKLTVRIAKELSDLAEKQAIKQGSPDWFDLYRKTLLFCAPDDFECYLLYIQFNLPFEKQYYRPRRGVFGSIVQDLQDLHDDLLDGLSISSPPGTGKSGLGLFYVSWIAGKYPDTTNLAIGHSNALTKSFYLGVYEVITSDEYLFKDVFPASPLILTNAESQVLDLKSKRRYPTLTCRSIEGSLTGVARAEKILYCDDLVQGREEAMSKERLATKWALYTDNAKNRKKDMPANSDEPSCKELHIATRWSVHDPIGKLQQLYGDDPRWKFVAIPALNEQDESNFDYPTGFSTAYFHDMRNTVDPVTWSCLFQNEPMEREGQLFSDEQLQRFTQLPEGVPDAVIAIADPSEGKGDDTFMAVANVYGDEAYIVDCVVSDLNPDMTDLMMAVCLIKNDIHLARFESNGPGGRTADKVAEICQKRGHFVTIQKRRTTTNKETKILVESDYILKKFWFKARSEYERSDPYAKMMQKLGEYSTKQKNKHDDIPDGLSQLSIWLREFHRADPTVFDRFI